MIIVGYISELLYDYECVIIPGLGGFITNERPASINRINHQFNPPLCQIYFNTHLKSNDGLLINHIVKKDGKSYNEVRQLVDQFVVDCKAKLKNGEKVLFENIGTLEFDADKNIRFEQFENKNYNPNAFGLSSFVSPVIKRQTDEGKIKGIFIPEKRQKSKPIDRKPLHLRQTKKKGFVRSPILIAVAAMLIFSLSWVVMNRGQVVNYAGEQASIFSFLNSKAKYQPRAESVKKEIVLLAENEEEQTAKEQSIPGDSELVKDENPTVAAEIIEATPEVGPETVPETITEKEVVKPVVKEVVAEPVKYASKRYYIIAGSFSEEKNANKLVGQLRNKGFEAVIADTNKNGMYRVAYTSRESLALAKEELFAIRQDDNADAWILRK